ncbi:unnamed protein product [Rodentolepis nana]|uniref:Cell wall protein n=1 Tax=Rodentolepis nana TaxID=102285 RepID=A0A0R3T0L2_RODNA|nr:unnamed protein product [Rodentolepis nana]
MDAGFSTDLNPPVAPAYYNPRIIGGYTQPYYDPAYPPTIPGRVPVNRNPFPAGTPIAGANPNVPLNPGVFGTYDERSRGGVNP